MESTYSEPISRRYITPENARGFGQNMFLGGTLKREVELRSTNQDAWSSSRTNNQLPLFTFEDIGDWTPPATNVFINTNDGGGSGNDLTANVLATSPINVAAGTPITSGGVTSTPYTVSLSNTVGDWNNYVDVFNNIGSVKPTPLLIQSTSSVTNFDIPIVNSSNAAQTGSPITYRVYDVKVLTPQLRSNVREWLFDTNADAKLIDLGHTLPLDIKTDGGISSSRLDHNVNLDATGSVILGQKIPGWTVGAGDDYYIAVIPTRISVACD